MTGVTQNAWHCAFHVASAFDDDNDEGQEDTVPCPRLGSELVAEIWLEYRSPRLLCRLCLRLLYLQALLTPPKHQQNQQCPL